MKRFKMFWTLMLCPLVALSMSQQAQIYVSVVAVDPLSYNVRPLPTTPTGQTQNTLSPTPQKTSGASIPTCQKTIYFNNVPYQISAAKYKQATSCSIDALGGQSYGIMLTDV